MIEQEDHRKEGLKRIGHQYAHSEKFGGVSKSMLKQSRLNFDKIEKCE